jgi:hypothetical protein
MKDLLCHAVYGVLCATFILSSFGFFKIMLDALPSHDDVLNPTL